MKCILLSKVLLRNKPIKKILNNKEDNHKKRGPTSVPSERLFSSSSDQIWPKRNMLSDDMFERIVLIQKNI